MVVFPAIFVMDRKITSGYNFGASLNRIEIKYYGNFNKAFSFETFVIILTECFFSVPEKAILKFSESYRKSLLILGSRKLYLIGNSKNVDSAQTEIIAFVYKENWSRKLLVHHTCLIIITIFDHCLINQHNFLLAHSQ